MTIQTKAVEQYFPVVLFIMLYIVGVTFGSVGVILKCDHSNESYRANLSCVVLFMILCNVVITLKSVDVCL